MTVSDTVFRQDVAGGTGTRGDIVRVLMVCPTYPPNDVPCGVGDYARELVEHLAVSGVSVTVVASSKHRPGPEAPVRVVPLTDRWDHQALTALVRMVRREEVDLVHVQYTPELFGRSPWMKLLPGALALGGGPPVIITAHTVVGGYPSSRVLAPLLFGFSTRIICPNDEATDLLSRALPFLRRRIRAIPIGSAIPGPSAKPKLIRAAIRAEFNLGTDTPLLAHFGFARPGKGMETLIAAAARLRAAGIKFVLLMIGGAYPDAEDYFAELRARGRAAGLNGEVLWLGHCSRERVATLLAASDIYVVPYDDGISARRSTLLAAITHQLPIVSTRPARPTRWFRDGENVVLVPPRDHVALAGALNMLITSPEARERVRLGAGDLAAEFSWPHIAGATVAVYQEVRR